MHAASKAGTLGSCVMLIALAIYADDLAVTTRALGGVVFFLLTAPVSAHLLAKAAHASGLRLWRMSVVDDYAAGRTADKICDSVACCARRAGRLAQLFHRLSAEIRGSITDW